MISYEPLWKTMEIRKISGYSLVYHYGLSSNTLRRAKKNLPLNTTTINQLALILKCNIWDIISFTATEEELQEIEERKQETIARYSHPRKKKNTE